MNDVADRLRAIASLQAPGKKRVIERPPKSEVQVSSAKLQHINSMNHRRAMAATTSRKRRDKSKAGR